MKEVTYIFLNEFYINSLEMT